MFITKTCLHCNKEFAAMKKEIKRGNGKYCSKICSHEHRKGAKKQPNVTCSTCKTPFRKSPSKQKLSKSGLFFCSKHCKDVAQRINSPASQSLIFPSHFKYGEYSDYRKICFEHYETRCNRCGFNSIPEILEVHHKDRDRTNNNISNLEPLCPTCHQAEHFHKKDGKWSGTPNGI